jgi:hypothetical protein
VGRYGVLGALAATDLQRDDRLAHGSGAVERADKAIGLPDGLDEYPCPPIPIATAGCCGHTRSRRGLCLFVGATFVITTGWEATHVD